MKTKLIIYRSSIKKWLLLFLCMAFSLVANAEKVKIGDLYYELNESAKTAIVASSADNGYSGDITIPSSVTYSGNIYSVTSIGSSAFSNCISLTSITIPEGVSSIGNWAFYYCTGVTSITIPSSVTNIGEYAFSNCISLTSITIPEGVTSVGNRAFYHCTGVTSITIPSSVTNIGEYAFDSYSGLKSAGPIGSGCNIEYGWTESIPNYAFYGCNLKSVVIGSKIASIGNGAFISRPVKTIWLPNTPPSGYKQVSGTVNYAANNLYSALSNVKVYPYLSSMFEQNGMTFVPVSPSERTCDVIDYQQGLAVENVSFENGVEYRGIRMNVKNISQYAFYDCKSLKSINMGQYAETVEPSAFYNCSSLENVTLGRNTNTIGANAFSGCANMENTVLPVSLRNIGNNAFEGCKKFTDIKIPRNVTMVGDNVFKGCTSVQRVIFADRTETVSLGSNGNAPLFADCPLDSVYIGGNIVYCTASDKGYSPFYRNATLRSVVVADCEDQIDVNEFYGCSNLRNVSIGDSVKTIGDWAFSGCSSLETFRFGSAVQTIGREAFSDCTNMTRLLSCATVPPVCGGQALDDINKFNCTLQVPEGCEAAYQKADQWKEFFFIEGVNDVRCIFATYKADVYTIDGKPVGKSMDAATIANELPKGLYIINGKKVLVK